jgi:hypothetical protein
MKPDEHGNENHTSATSELHGDSADLQLDGVKSPTGDTGWRLWPPSPKMQIVMIALGFGLFNLILLAIWAIVMVYRF